MSDTTQADKALAALAVATHKMGERRSAAIARRAGIPEKSMSWVISQLVQAGLAASEHKGGHQVFVMTQSGWDKVGVQPPAWWVAR